MNDMQLKALINTPARKPYEFRKGDLVRIRDGSTSKDTDGWYEQRASEVGKTYTVREDIIGTSYSSAINVIGSTHNLWRACWLELVTPAPHVEQHVEEGPF